MLLVKLIRHGESEFNRQGRIQGHTNSPLSPLGRIQAELTGRWLKENACVSKVYASPLKRALETARIVSSLLDVPLVEEDAFKEIGLGVWEGMEIDRVRERDPENFRLWFTEPAKARVPQSEGLGAFRERVIGTFNYLVERERGEIAIITHGGVISVIVAHILGLDVNHIWRIRLDNASITEVSFHFSIPKVTLLNSTCHLGRLGRTGASIWNLKRP